MRDELAQYIGKGFSKETLSSSGINTVRISIFHNRVWSGERVRGKGERIVCGLSLAGGG
ncbi:hypothetical protein [Nostoc sp. 'Peltigera membranacea cyanobiont' 232]|uniref:hypothetical protein n=1 Tax=Nostoc sp. 'Peltigera membranacea cyanobiont' 232 TaxID=2014531 RepID=UPI001674FC8D|nr:hypothetical protein [Nostoc sp. 'Peltigera membranacea cyanobiont' 232]